MIFNVFLSDSFEVGSWQDIRALAKDGKEAQVSADSVGASVVMKLK